MKILDIVNEKVDMSFWKKLDSIYNPDALEQVKKQEKRHALVSASVDKGSTPVFTKPVRKHAAFTTKPKKGEPTSAGYRGNINTRVKSGHISQETGKNLIRNT